MSTYAWLGIPDSVATVLALVALSFLLAPWFGGAELGPLKVPQLGQRVGRLLRYTGPLVFAATIAAFFPAWQRPEPAQFGIADVETYDELSEVEIRWLEDKLGDTVWEGETGWGTVTFDQTGRKARYSNTPGRSPGIINIIGSWGGSGFILFPSEWSQDDGKEGRMEILVPGYGEVSRVQIRWGPNMSIINDWTQLSREQTQK